MNELKNPYASPKSELSNNSFENKEYEGLAGWLILVAIGVVLSPVRLFKEIVLIYKPMFEDGTWELLTTEDSEFYNSMWAPLLTGEIIFNSLMLLASLYLVYLFFSKHYLFPKFYIGIVVVSLIFVPLYAWLITIIMPDEPMFDSATSAEMIKSIISAVIWIPYMLVSKRVKATFVRKQSNESSR